MYEPGDNPPGSTETETEPGLVPVVGVQFSQVAVFDTVQSTVPQPLFLIIKDLGFEEIPLADPAKVS